MATLCLLVLLGPMLGGDALRGASQEPMAEGWAQFHRFDEEAARAAFVRSTATGRPIFATVGHALTYLPHPHQPGSYSQGREMLLSVGPTREARLAGQSGLADRLGLRLLEAAFGSDQPQPAWPDLIQISEALGATGVWDRRASLLLTARFLVSAPAAGSSAPQAGVLLRTAAALEDLVGESPSDVDSRHYLIRLYLRRGEAAQARRHARVLLGQPTAPRLAEAALLALTAAGDWAAASDGMSSYGASLLIPDSTRLLWHAYVLLQEGRMGEAESLLRPLWAIPAEAALPARTTQARARALWVIESRRWMDARLSSAPVGMEPDVVAGELLAAGMAGVRVGNQQQAMDALARMALLVGDGDQALPVVTTVRPAPGAVRPGVSRPGVAPIPTARPMRPGATGTVSTSDDPAVIRQGFLRRRAAVMAQQMEAVSIFAEGRRDEAIVLARQAAAVADDLPSDWLWPAPAKPAHELVGDFLLESRRPVEAMVAYQDSLNRWPMRPLSLLGLYRAATLARDAERAAVAKAQLAVVWSRGDRSWSEIAELLGTVRK